MNDYYLYIHIYFTKVRKKQLYKRKFTWRECLKCGKPLVKDAPGLDIHNMYLRFTINPDIPSVSRRSLHNVSIDEEKDG